MGRVWIGTTIKHGSQIAMEEDGFLHPRAAYSLCRIATCTVLFASAWNAVASSSPRMLDPAGFPDAASTSFPLLTFVL